MLILCSILVPASIMPLGVLAGKQNHVAHLTSATGGPAKGLQQYRNQDLKG